MSYQVALGFEDGVTRFVTCGPTETVADASYKARINIPLDCRDGACGTCKSLCESGDFDGGDYIDDALTDAEAEDGYCLPCQMMPRSDLVVQIPTTSDVAKTEAAAHPATVTAVERLAEGAFALTVELDQREDLAFLPGQYVNIAVPGTDQVRSYSFSTGPDDTHLSFLIKYAAGGAMSEYLARRCAVGDRLELTGPMGSFFLRESERPLLLLAGGTGLAPVLSILESLAASGTRDRPVHLVYGTSFDTDVVYTELLDEFTTRLPGLTWDLVVADPESRHPNTGYVTGLIRPEHLHDGTADIYLCGPPPMVTAVRGFLDENALEVTHLYFEKFTPATAVPDGATEAPDVGGTEAGATTVEIPEAADEPEPTEPTERTGVATAPAPEVTPVTVTDGAAAPITAADAAESAPPIAARPAGFAPRTPGLFEVVSPGSSLTDDHGVRIGARPVGFVPRPVTVGPARTSSPDGTTTATTVSTPRGDRSETVTAAEGVISGEVHPGIEHSDAQFDARMALELGAIELTIGRLDESRLAEFRMLAESANRYIDGDHFTDARGFSAANAQFHEFLFRCTQNEALLQAYRMLEVTRVMNSVLPDARWVSEEIVPEHLEIVAAFESVDRDAARYLIRRHTEHAKATMRAALEAGAVGVAGAVGAAGSVGVAGTVGAAS